MKLRTNEDIISTLKLTQSTRLSVSQSTMMLSGLVYAMVLDKDLFKHNPDLEGFVLKIFRQWLPDHEQFRPYVYKSRTLLGSKISRIILDTFEYNDTTEVATKLSSLFSSATKEASSAKKLPDLEAFISDWLTSLGEDQ
ncbi:hypothetical protein [Lacticaseibacillus sp. 866-1]|uniref:hypothetical protein n=1 Tax=Lacticaseibacillus sp. 866-1 TaxID=2799576 RepID=UPI0019439B71|nr:hypothetical protein [Lacticaseibacillus sp. 866-1]